MLFKDASCSLCKWFVIEGDSSFGVCADGPASAIVEIPGDRPGTISKRWKQPLMPATGKCSRFLHKDTNEEIE